MPDCEVSWLPAGGMWGMFDGVVSAAAIASVTQRPPCPIIHHPYILSIERSKLFEGEGRPPIKRELFSFRRTPRGNVLIFISFAEILHKYVEHISTEQTPICSSQLVTIGRKILFLLVCLMLWFAVCTGFGTDVVIQARLISQAVSVVPEIVTNL